MKKYVKPETYPNTTGMVGVVYNTETDEVLTLPIALWEYSEEAGTFEPIFPCTVELIHGMEVDGDGHAYALHDPRSGMVFMMTRASKSASLDGGDWDIFWDDSPSVYYTSIDAWKTAMSKIIDARKALDFDPATGPQ